MIYRSKVSERNRHRSTEDIINLTLFIHQTYIHNLALTHIFFNSQKHEFTRPGQVLINIWNIGDKHPLCGFSFCFQLTVYQSSFKAEVALAVFKPCPGLSWINFLTDYGLGYFLNIVFNSGGGDSAGLELAQSAPVDFV